MHEMRDAIFSFGRSMLERGAWFLAPISWIWALVVLCRNALYDLEWFSAYRVDRVVVSVGNIIAGGTGKTPFVHKLALSFPHRKVAILSRGYGMIPDEAMLLQRRLPCVKVYIGKDRAALASVAVSEGADLILLDDGFQHRRLHRDFDLVLVTDSSGLQGVRKEHYLPWGFLRDSPKRLAQADAIFVRGRDFQPAVTRVLNADGQELLDLRELKVGLFCGIGNPKFFRQTVKDLGALTVAEWILADHAPARLSSLQSFCCQCNSLGANVILTTEKDFIKLPSNSLPIFYVEIEIELTRGKEKWDTLIAKIDQKIDNSMHLWMS